MGRRGAVSTGGGDMDMPARKPEGTMVPESGPLGDDCKLRGGVSLRRNGGECDAAIRLRALPGELLRNGVSKTFGYLANCWMTMALLPVSAGCGSGDLKGASIFFLSFACYWGYQVKDLGSRSSSNTTVDMYSVCTRITGIKIKYQSQQNASDDNNATGVVAWAEGKTRIAGFGRAEKQKRRKWKLPVWPSLSEFYFGLRGLPLPAPITA
jgi:hypothetical protein